jgi:hypothetical protein
MWMLGGFCFIYLDIDYCVFFLTKMLNDSNNDRNFEWSHNDSVSSEID